MAQRSELLAFLNNELHSEKFDDASLNGLQIEGRERVQIVCTAVDSGLSVIERACAAKADLLIVHHGLFWGGAQAIVGNFKTSVKIAINHELNLFASHLPLDAHEQFGNNFGLARFLGLNELRLGIPWGGRPIGCVAKNNSGLTVEELRQRLTSLPGIRDILVLPFGPAIPNQVGVVTGSGSDGLWRFREEGFDTLITGEPRQSIYHFAKENRLNVICAGHYATETIGVRLLGDELHRRFNVEHLFIDEPTGI